MPVTTDTRRTGVSARLIDTNSNSWEDFAGIDINIPVAYQYDIGGGPDEWEQGYWGYRGQASMVKSTANGAIIRVRIGDGSSADRQVYRQVITDPTDPDEWETWDLLYTGDHYAICLTPDPSGPGGYRIWHAKSDGLYTNDFKLYSITNIVRIKPTLNEPRMVWVQTVHEAEDGGRYLDWQYSPDAVSGEPFVDDAANYRWYRSDLAAVNYSDTYLYRFRAIVTEGGAREQFASQTLVLDRASASDLLDDTEVNEYDNVRYLEGPSGSAGYTTIEGLYVTYFEDMTGTPEEGTAYRYLFYTKRQRDAIGNTLSNLKMPLYWRRAGTLDYRVWSAPVPTGYSVWGFSGAIHSGDYVYAAGNGRVIRRPSFASIYDITNYVKEGSYSLPRDNAAGQGSILCANPRNRIGRLMDMIGNEEWGLTERKLELAVGYKRASDDDWTWKQDSPWWVSGMSKTKDSSRENLKIAFGDHWHRLSLPFMDVHSMPGKFEWSDWQPSAPNRLYNYSNATDEFLRYNPEDAPEDTIPRLRATSSGTGPYGNTITLFDGQMFENAHFTSRLFRWGSVVFRYNPDGYNFYAVALSPEGVTLRRFTGSALEETHNEPTNLASWEEPIFSTSDGTYLTVDFRWNRIRVYINFDDEPVIDYTLDPPDMWTGFVGWMSSTIIEVANFAVNEFNVPMTTAELIHALLAYADIQDVLLLADDETASAPQIDILWGPQSDLKTPEQALRQLLEASKLNIAWRET